MNAYLKVLILIFIEIILFMKVGFWFGMIGLPIIIYRILKIFGITRSLTIFRGPFFKGIVFLKDYQGPFSKSKEAFQEASNLIRSFKLKDYVLIGIYYDKPGEVEESKLRYSVGIYRKNLDKPTDELESYSQSKGFYFAELPDSTSLYTTWEYFNSFTMMMGITKFNMLLKQKLQDADFKRTFKIKDNDCKVTVELYDTDSSIKFYVPLLNAEKFQLYKKDK